MHVRRFKKKLGISGLILILGMLSSLSFASAWGAAAPEEKIRAAFVLGILRFTQWPGFTPTPENPLLLCSLGDSEAASIIAEQADELLNQKSIRLVAKASPESCHALLVGGSASRKEVLAYANHPVLTICDDCEAPDDTVVRLVRSGRRVGVEVNLSDVDKVGLKMSAQLLEVAQIVRD